MARTRKGVDRFAFRITLVPEDRPRPKPPWIGTHQWKHRAIYSIKMKFTIQVQKAANRAAWKWYKFYSVVGYGAPGRLEFICPYSGMVGKMIQQEEAMAFRRYWARCAEKSSEILEWLNSIQVHSYSSNLHRYLLRLIVIEYNIREMEEYTKANPFNKTKQW